MFYLFTAVLKTAIQRVQRWSLLFKFLVGNRVLEYSNYKADAISQTRYAI